MKIDNFFFFSHRRVKGCEGDFELAQNPDLVIFHDFFMKMFVIFSKTFKQNCGSPPPLPLRSQTLSFRVSVQMTSPSSSSSNWRVSFPVKSDPIMSLYCEKFTTLSQEITVNNGS
jgi:hypothetical protein